MFKRGKSGSPEISLGPVVAKSAGHKLSSSASTAHSTKSYPPGGGGGRKSPAPGISFSFGGGNGNKGKQVTKYGDEKENKKNEEEPESMIGGLFPFGLQLPHISIGGHGDGTGPYIR